ncbi:MAG: methylthioribose-phosphate isomerase [Abditibacteriota bacterium]|nr:methylthioribose-phosphate isomerase [Abditibacteriota bacterium]
MLNPSTFQTVAARDDIGPHGAVRLLDQTLLPHEVRYVDLCDWREVVDAISSMIVRGAPAIGCTAALGLALAARQTPAHDSAELLRTLTWIGEEFKASRPTAVNLMWAIDRLLDVARAQAAHQSTLEAVRGALQQEALAIVQEDVAANRRIGLFGARLLPRLRDRATRILTHCNAGALATAGYGTALGVVRAAHEMGIDVEVWADETRPRLQGMKLTAWELMQDQIPVTVIADDMAAVLMREGRVDAVVVGADRIAANGDVANKIGTYNVAVQARFHNVPFYVAAPLSTIDFACADGTHIPLEERDTSEMTHLETASGALRIAPESVAVWNPAFDVTPAKLVTAIITEAGVAHAPLPHNLARLCTQ